MAKPLETSEDAVGKTQNVSDSNNVKCETVLEGLDATEEHLSSDTMDYENDDDSLAENSYRTIKVEPLISSEDSQAEQKLHVVEETMTSVPPASKHSEITDRRSTLDIYCKDCEHNFSTRERYERHLKEDSCIHTCEICGRVFLHGKKYHYLHHMKRHHKQADYKCDICTKTFVTKGELNFHVKTNHTINEVGVCDLCGATFRNVRNMRQHRRIMHGENKGNYQCPHCSRLLATKDSLKCHIKNVHTGPNDRLFSCPTCTKVFKTKSTLKQHETYHTLSKTFKCNHCQASFKRKGDLTLHKKRHAKVFSFFCQTCGKGFHDTNKLKYHENTHTGEKPYKCELCDYRCACKSNIPIHMKRVHEKVK